MHRRRIHLVVISEDEDRDSGAEGKEPLYKHLCKFVGIFLREGVEEVSAQEVEQHAAGHWGPTAVNMG